MTVDQQRRSALYDRLVATLGQEEAGTMFELLPPGGVDLATTADIDRLGHRVNAVDQRITNLGQRMDDRFTAVEQRMDDRFAVVDQRFTAMEHRTDDRIDGLRGELLSAFHSELSKIHEHLATTSDTMTAMAGRMANQTRSVTVAAMSTALTITASAIALSRLL